MAVITRSEVVAIICKTLDWDAERGGHTVESIIYVLQDMGIVGPRVCTPMQIRLMIAAMLDRGDLDMCPDGSLFVPESPDPLVEKFQGAWYLTTADGLIKGSFATQGEALHVSFAY